VSMGIVLFFLLFLVVVAIVVYPLLPGRVATAAPPAASHRTWTDRRIKAAVRRVHEARSRTGLICPACGRAYEAGDRFCVRCGTDLPQDKTAEDSKICPSCGGALRPGDIYCSRCGHHLSAEEAS
jgi:predicted amidophosphoribosyltransferase